MYTLCCRSLVSLLISKAQPVDRLDIQDNFLVIEAVCLSLKIIKRRPGYPRVLQPSQRVGQVFRMFRSQFIQALVDQLAGLE